MGSYFAFGAVFEHIWGESKPRPSDPLSVGYITI